MFDIKLTGFYRHIHLFDLWSLNIHSHPTFFSSWKSQVGQKHSGFFGLVEKIISAAVPTVWFDRDEILDRHLTARRLKEHTHSPDAVPLLIFPEGTCINNTSVMKFKKGCFEVGAPIHPVAIKVSVVSSFFLLFRAALSPFFPMCANRLLEFSPSPVI